MSFFFYNSGVALDVEQPGVLARVVREEREAASPPEGDAPEGARRERKREAASPPDGDKPEGVVRERKREAASPPDGDMPEGVMRVSVYIIDLI